MSAIGLGILALALAYSVYLVRLNNQSRIEAVKYMYHFGGASCLAGMGVLPFLSAGYPGYLFASAVLAVFLMWAVYCFAWAVCERWRRRRIATLRELTTPLR